MRLMMREKKMMRTLDHQRNQIDVEILRTASLLDLSAIDLTLLIDAKITIMIKMTVMTILTLK